MESIYICNFIVPLVMLYLSYLFKKKTFKEIGSNGYSTPRSRKSQELWDYAQQISPIIFGKVGMILLLVEVVVTAILIFAKIDFGIGVVIGGIVELVGGILAFVLVERKLKRV